MGQTLVNPATPFSPMSDPGPAVELELVRDMTKRALWITPAVLLLSFLIWRVPGVLSTGLALSIVVLNFVMAAWMNGRAAKISFALLGGVAMFGFILRLSIVFVAFWLTKGSDWMRVVPFGLTVVIAHLGLLFWEMKYVSATLAFPGLKPSTKPSRS